MLRRGVGLGSLLVVGALACAPAHASGPKRCSPPHYPGVGYFTSLTVSGASCSTGTKLVKAYYKCRISSGGKSGKCTKPVLGYRCSEKRNAIPTEIDARVTCTRRSARIVHTYQQDL